MIHSEVEVSKTLSRNKRSVHSLIAEHFYRSVKGPRFKVQNHKKKKKKKNKTCPDITILKGAGRPLWASTSHV